jgi:hypothetical protein
MEHTVRVDRLERISNLWGSAIFSSGRSSAIVTVAEVIRVRSLEPRKLPEA